MYAALCTSTPLTPDAILRLTPRQIHAIYQHPRDKDGQILWPKQTEPERVTPKTAAEIEAEFRAKAVMLGIKPDQIESVVRKLREKHAAG
jgi:hypothetical protein